MQGALSFEHSPPLWLPFSFFLAAPCWLLLFAAEASQIGAELVSASPLALALTHTLALGVLGNVMLGALFQVLSVLSGIGPRHPGRWLHGIFWPFQLGSALLVAAFLNGLSPLLLSLGASILLLTLLSFSLLFSLAACKTPARDPSTRGIRLALLGLAITVLLGATLSGILSRGWALDFSHWLPLHILWASNGWLLMLLMSVALTVVPMFQITAPYPRLLRSLLPAALFFALLAGLTPLVALADLIFLLVTFKLEWQSRRRHDLSRRFWLIAMGMGLITLLLWATSTSQWPQWLMPEQRTLLIGWLWLAGLGIGSLCAMLYKIVPFLVWLHLKTGKPARGALPPMQAFMPAQAQWHSLLAYCFWLVSGSFCAWLPAYGRWPLCISSALLASLLLLHIGQALLRGHRLQQNG